MNIKVININNSKKYGKKPTILGDELYIYCGRPRPLSNPYYIGKDGNRDEAIEKFKKDLDSKTTKSFQAYKETIKFIKKKNFSSVTLGCHCKPKKCHCDILKDKLEKDLAPTIKGYYSVLIEWDNGESETRVLEGVGEGRYVTIELGKNIGWVVFDDLSRDKKPAIFKVAGREIRKIKIRKVKKELF